MLANKINAKVANIVSIQCIVMYCIESITIEREEKLSRFYISPFCQWIALLQYTQYTIQRSPALNCNRAEQSKTEWMNGERKNTKLVKIVIPFSTPSIRYYHFNHVEFGILRSFPFFHVRLRPFVSFQTQKIKKKQPMTTVNKISATKSTHEWRKTFFFYLFLEFFFANFSILFHEQWAHSSCAVRFI